MSQEYFFKIESNIKEECKGFDEKKNDIIYGHESWIIWFKEYHYQNQVQQYVKDWKKEINTYGDLCNFVISLNKKGIQVETIPKIYYIENNGEQKE